MRIILNLCLLAILAIFTQSCNDDDVSEMIDCEVKLAVREASCSSFTFYNVDQLMMDWEVNGEFIERGRQFSYEAGSAGTFTICGNFEKENCPSDTLVCEVIEVGVDCIPENPCQVDLITTESSCSTFSFSNSLQVVMDWSVNDSLVTTSEVFEFEAIEAGSFEICGFFETPDCPSGDQVCTVLQIADNCFPDTSNEACEIAINMEEISCSTFSLSNSRQAIMDWRVDGELITTAQVFEFEAEEAGSYEICGFFESPDCPSGNEECVTVVVQEDCFTNEDCEIEVIVESTSCSSFFLGNSRQAIMDWRVDSVLMSTAVTYEFVAEEAGSYEICGFFESPDCPSGNEECVTVVVEEDCFVDDVCEVEVMVEGISCSRFFLTNSRRAIMDWRVDGVLMSTGVEYIFETQVLGSFEICGFFESPECPLGGQDCKTIDIEEDCF